MWPSVTDHESTAWPSAQKAARDRTGREAGSLRAVVSAAAPRVRAQRA